MANYEWDSYLAGKEQQQASNEIAKNVGGYSGEAIDKMGGSGVQILMQGDETRKSQNNQYKNQSKLMDQDFGYDIKKNQQGGDYDLLQTILSKGGITGAQRDAALSRYGEVMDLLRNAAGIGQQYAQNGGYNDNEYGAMMGGYQDTYSRYGNVADNGALRQDEYDRILNSGRNDLMRQGRNAAESTFNQMNQGSPFAAGALMAQSAANTGAEMVKQRADLDKYQADSRLKGIAGMNESLSGAGGLAGDRADNRISGVDSLRQLAGEGAGVADSMAGIDTMLGEDSAGGLYDKLLARLGLQSDATQLENGKSQLGSKKYGKDKTKDINDGIYNPYLQSGESKK